MCKKKEESQFISDPTFQKMAFLSFVMYYRRFFKGFSKVALPLRKLLIGLESQGRKAAKHTPVDWGEVEKMHFIP